MLPETPKAEPTLQEIEDKSAAQARGSAKGRASVVGTKPTKVKTTKDSASLPAGVKQAIESKKGTPGWKTGIEAAQSVKKHWSALRKDHPGLDMSTVLGFIENVYGQTVTAAKVDKAGSSDGFDALVDSAINNALRK
jgi:hypothetical protein